MTVLDDLRARLFLLRAAEPPAPALHQYVAVHGVVETVEHIWDRSAPAAVLNEITRPAAQIGDDLRALDAGTARVITPEDNDWPTGRLTSLPGGGAPLALWMRGDASLAALTHHAVTITGARAASSYGETIAAEMSYDLAEAGVTVISGGGFGVDAAAHRGALAAHGPTIVVLAHGVDQTYPSAHAQLFQSVIDNGGLLVSEYPLGARPSRVRLHTRCRLLAALTAATVIVEAGQRSGAFAVVRAATQFGRRAYGVPGPINSATSVGVHELLRTGAATLASSVEHINYQDGLR
ncbi:DNA-processing protein DprA [Actinokineospora inagensis]|uniref:DNA-processing protein DprA n=1 Tax=Actinokineospora inagensis TaxID=103730 RepID=UPI000A01F9B6|nr:DNA-processing protein DprA [Actinokineospora inagensis]